MSDSPSQPELFGEFERLAGPAIGAGATGHVYRARQVSLDRPVALKVVDILPRDETRLQALLARTEREAKVLARLRHPNIVSVYGTGVKDGAPWLAMDCLEGGTLEDAVKRRIEERRPFSEVEITKIGIDAASGLAAAHRQGIFHRDLKPTNILFDSDGQAVVTDFGMAAFHDAREGEKITGSGDVLGTPEYMAPEQIFPAAGHTVDHRADIYALGAVLYTMAALRPPFSGRTPYELMHRHLNDPPAPLRATAPQYGADFESLILKCLAKNPAERPGYEEVLTALEGIRTPVDAPSPPSEIRRFPWKLIAVGAAVAILLAVWRLRPVRERPEHPDSLETNPITRHDPGTGVREEPREEKKDERLSQETQKDPPREETLPESREEEPPETIDAFLARYNPSEVELRCLAILRGMLRRHARTVRLREYDASLGALATLPAPTDYTRRHRDAAMALLLASRRLVERRRAELAEAMIEVVATRRDGTEIRGVVSRVEGDTYTFRCDGRTIDVALSEFGSADFTRDATPFEAIAFLALDGAPLAALEHLLKGWLKDRRLLWVLGTLAHLAVAWVLEEHADGRDEPIARAALLAPRRELVLRYAPYSGPVLDRLARHAAALEELRAGRLGEVLKRFEGTVSHARAVRRILERFEGIENGDLLTGAELLAWTLEPRETTLERRRAHYDIDPKTQLVLLRDDVGSHALGCEAPSSRDGIVVRARWSPAKGAKNPSWAVVLDESRIELSSGVLAVGHGEKTILSWTDAAPPKAGGWQILALLPVDDRLALYLDGRFVGHVALAPFPLGKSLKFQVTQGLLELEKIRVHDPSKD